MKLLLFSDNHRDRESLEKMIENHPKIDRIISLGDSEMKEHELTNLNIFGVKGNYPSDPRFPKELTLVFSGVKFYLTHGHHHSVKMGLRRLLNHAIYNEIDVACFGHTHRPYLQEVDGVILLNPGSLSKYRAGNKNSYAVIELTDKSIDIVIRTIKGEILTEYHKNR